jgi:tRNA/rRNA methyltransferase
MDNMGLDRLILVSPRTEIDVHAREGAASAQAILARRIVYESIDEFYKNEGEGLRLAFTRRTGHRRELFDFGSFCKDELAPKLKGELAETPIYLLFGSEDDGLNNEELEFANHCVQLPTFGENGSYNLAQAVLIAAFILQSELAQAGVIEKKEAGKDFVRGPVEFPKDLIKDWLLTLGFDLSEARRRNAAEIVNNMILRGIPSPDESRILASVVHQTIRKLKERNGKD